MPTQSGKFGVAVIGSGQISDAYVRAIAAVPKAEAVWCHDIVESQAKRLGEHFGIAWTTELDRILSDPAVDAVIVCVPHLLHGEITIRAAQAGKHVMCDKPITTNREDALAMIEECRKANVRLGVNLASRYQPCATEAKKLFARKVIGDIFFTKISCYAHKPDEYWISPWLEKSWRASKKMAGGAIGIMNMTHDIDRMMFSTGMRITQTKGEYGTFVTDVEVEDTFCGLWRWENGAIGMVSAGSKMLGGSAEPTRVFGSRGQIELWDPVRVFTTREDTEFAPNEWNTLDIEWAHSGYDPYITDFIESVRKDTPAPITGEDGFRILDVILGIYESCETGGTVHMRTDI